MERREAVRKVVRVWVEVREKRDWKFVGWEIGERVRAVPKRMPVINGGMRVVMVGLCGGGQGVLGGCNW